MNCRDQYIMFLNMGELKEVLPGSTGDWIKDKSIFLEYCKATEKVFDLDVIIDNEDFL